jgi:hypothetical protein
MDELNGESKNESKNESEEVMQRKDHQEEEEGLCIRGCLIRESEYSD